MIKISIQKLIESGFHFGHKANKWNPKMKPYIYNITQGIHVIDMKKSAQQLLKAVTEIHNALAKNKAVLFVCTKLHAKAAVRAFCEKNDLPFVTERWIGGTLTNFEIIKKRVKDYGRLKEQSVAGTLEATTKKEKGILEKKIEKMETNFSGIQNLRKIPSVVVIFDTIKDKTALAEAKSSKCKIVAIVDSNTDPDNISICIPGSDDAPSAVDYILSIIEEAIKTLPKRTED